MGLVGFWEGVVKLLSTNSQVAATKNQISSDLADEAIILDLKTGVYYGLGEVGARIWGLIQEPQTIQQIKNVILSEYEVDEERCERDLLNLIQDLAAKGLVEVSDEQSS